MNYLQSNRPRGASAQCVQHLPLAGLIAAASGLAFLASAGCDLGTYDQRMQENIQSSKIQDSTAPAAQQGKSEDGN